MKALWMWHANAAWKISCPDDAFLAANLDCKPDNVLQFISIIKSQGVLQVTSEACRAKLITVNTYLEFNFLF